MRVTGPYFWQSRVLADSRSPTVEPPAEDVRAAAVRAAGSKNTRRAGGTEALCRDTVAQGAARRGDIDRPQAGPLACGRG